MSKVKDSTTRRRILQQAALASGAAALMARKAAAEGGPVWQRLFPAGFHNERIKTSGAEINAVIGGSGPPVLLFHGAPQSLITWRMIAPDLAKEYTLVMCDLRGYGD
jgi:haloacetate dehalogenase